MKAYYAPEILTEHGPVADSYLLEDQGKVVGIVQEPAAGIPVTVYDHSTIAPGLIDIHTHGALGHEAGYCGKEHLLQWAEFNLTHGVTGFLPSTASIPVARIRETARLIRELTGEAAPNILGLHMEGPFFGVGPKIGAQNPLYAGKQFTPEYRGLIAEYRNVIKYIAVDPALETAAEMVSFCNGLGIRVAAAHSDIPYAEFLKRKSWGFTAVTHTFNGMNGLDHRNPGLAYAGCMDPDLYGEIICDGHHVGFPMIKLFFKLKDYRRAVLITDSIAAAGMAPGSYTLGGIAIDVSAAGKVTKADGGLAGSILTLDQAVRNVVRHLGVPLSEAVAMASAVPAELLGIGDSKGSLGPGKDADFIVLNPELTVTATYLKGQNVFRAD